MSHSNMAAVDAGRLIILPSSSSVSIKSRGKRRKKTARKLKMSEDGEEDTSGGIRAPIVGYEVVDRREKFTVYKVHVRERERSWFVFRRYTDFVRLNDKLQNAFPGFHFKLPSKRWFKNNFDPDFIEERAHGLQFFLNNVMHHATICKSEIFKQFLCLDDPPGPYDSLEESRAYCQQLEDEVEDLKEQLHEITSELSATKSQLAQARVQQEALVSALKEERSANSLTKNMTQETNKQTFKPIIDGHRVLASRKGSSDSRKSDNSLEPENVESKNLWKGNLEIAAHSRGVDKIKPVSRRTPTQPLTSTPTKDFQPLISVPTKDSHIESFSNRDLSRKDSSEEAGDFQKTALENSKETIDGLTKSKTGLLSSNQCDDSNQEDKETLGNDASDNKTPSENSNKRDSGIILDSPSTTQVTDY